MARARYFAGDVARECGDRASAVRLVRSAHRGQSPARGCSATSTRTASTDRSRSSTPVRGHQALIEWTERWLEAWSSYSDRIEEIVDGGEVVVAAVSTHARGRTSGLEIRQRFFHVFEMREGRILRLREYLDRNSTLEAAGLPE